MKIKNKNYIIGLVMFILTLIFSYMGYRGIFFQYKYIKILKIHDNPLVFDKICLYIWPLIYIFSLIFLLLPYIKNLTMTDEEIYYEKLMPLFIYWNMANGIYSVMVNNNYLMPALIAIMGYSLVLITMVRIIDQYKDFSKKYKYLVTLPTGIHTGFLIFFVFTNILMYLGQNKKDPSSLFTIIFALILLILLSATILFVYKENKNPGLIIGYLWAMLGIISRQRPNKIIYIGSIILFALSIIISIYIKNFKEKNSSK